MLTLDHIVITAPSLEAGTRYVESKLGVNLERGGQHEAMGTHNRLLSLGLSDYLEVIAPDPSAAPPRQPRWFNLDSDLPGPSLTHWAARCANLQEALEKAPSGSGTAWDLARGALRWRMAVPPSGQTPYSGLFPALLQWECEPHPAEILHDIGIRLQELRISSPSAEQLEKDTRPLINEPRLRFLPAAEPRLEAVIKTPSGLVTL